MPERGAVSNLSLRLLPESSRLPPPPGCCEFRVRAVGLNFRDVLNVMGLYPGDPGEPGGDFAGTVVSVGEGVTKLKVGDSVYGVAPGCLKTFTTADVNLVSKIPRNISYEQAAALPVVSATVEVALNDIGKVKKGEKVLIHAASGGVGLLAIQYCRRVGATVYGTVGSEKKAEYLRSIGVEYITSSRDAAKFESDMKEFLGEDGRIDVVLNCLIGEFIPSSVKLMSTGGRFLELGKRGIWTKEEMYENRPDVQFDAIAIDTIMENDPSWFGIYLEKISALVERGLIKELPLQVFDMTVDTGLGAIAAFKFMQRAQHIGKVVIKVPSILEESREPPSSSDHFATEFLKNTPEENKTYVITGGLGSLGLILVKQLVEEGAKNIVLLSRKGKAPESVENSDIWKMVTGSDSRIKLLSLKCDVSNETEVKSVLGSITKTHKLPPIKGIFHAAGVLDDLTLDKQTRDSVAAVFYPKALGALYLHRAMEAMEKENPLDIFCMYSSVASLFGNYAQTNYGAANGYLDALAAMRHSKGLAGQSIQWGPWIEQGMAAELTKHLATAGLKGITNDLGVRALYDVAKAQSTEPIIGCQAIKWKVFLRRYQKIPPFFDLIAAAMAPESQATSLDMSKVTKAELSDVLAEIAKQVSGSDQTPPIDAPLMELGLDSLGAVEFRNCIVEATGVKLPQTLVFENPTILALADYILAENVGGRPSAAVSVVDEDEDYQSFSMADWLMSSLEPAERYLLYIEEFNRQYESLSDLIAEEDIMGALTDVLKVNENSDDFERLHVSWDELRNFHRNKKTFNVGAIVLEGSKGGSKQIHPIDDIENLIKTLDFSLDGIPGVIKPSEYKQAFLTGVTGFVGRVQLTTLLSLESHPDLVVHCVVRAKNETHAMDRIRAACKEAKCWNEDFVSRIVVYPGNFELPQFGIADETYNKLCKLIDVVYHTGGDVNLLCSYSRLRATNTLSMKHIIDFATTSRVKKVHFASTLGQFPPFFAVFAGEYANEYLTEESQPKREDMEKLFPPLRQGYPWSKWGAEQVLRAARDKGLPVSIYRLPNTYISYSTGYTNKNDYATALMISSVQEGIFPIGAATAPLTPVDTICDMIIGASVLEKPKHWLYHLFDQRLLKLADIESWSQELGIDYRGVKVDDFLDAIKARGPLSPVFKFVPLMQYWRTYWFDPDERQEPFPIRNDNIFEELPHISWPPLRGIFLNSFLYCMKAEFFSADSKSLYIKADDAAKAAQDICGLEDIGRDVNFIFEPIRIIREALLDECNPTFAGRLSLFRTTRQYLINLLSMEDTWKKHPEVEEIEIVKPVIICGLNRSGTTFLQNLMAVDPSNRSTRCCEMVAPYGKDGKFRPCGLPNKVIASEWDDDERVAYTQEVLDTQLGFSEEWMSIHSQQAAYPEEEFVILEHCGRSYSICAAFDVPSYRKWLFANDCQEMKNAYPFHKRFLQHLQRQRHGDRWLLKMPFHLFTLDALFETYPDARVIFTHRDPQDVIASWCSLVKYARQNLTGAIDEKIAERIGREELEAMSMMMSRALAFRKSRPDLADRFFDIQYTEFVKEPMDVVRRIYKEFLNVPLCDQAVANMSAYMENNRKTRTKLAKHQYKLTDVGLDESKVTEAFREYYQSEFLQ